MPPFGSGSFFLSFFFFFFFFLNEALFSLSLSLFPIFYLSVSVSLFLTVNSNQSSNTGVYCRFNLFLPGALLNPTFLSWSITHNSQIRRAGPMNDVPISIWLKSKTADLSCRGLRKRGKGSAKFSFGEIDFFYFTRTATKVSLEAGKTRRRGVSEVNFWILDYILHGYIFLIAGINSHSEWAEGWRRERRRPLVSLLFLSHLIRLIYQVSFWFRRRSQVALWTEIKKKPTRK